MGSTLKGKNLLLEEQILSFKSGSLPKQKIEELLHLQVYPLTLILFIRTTLYVPNNASFVKYNASLSFDRINRV